MNFNGFNYTGLSGVNIKTTAGIRFPMDGGFESTLSFKESSDQAYAWKLPAKSGSISLGGTFGVDLPVVASGGYLSTIVTVPNLRVEDGIVVTPQNRDAVAVISARGALFVANAIPGNGNVTLLLANAFATATVASTQSVFAYSVVR